MATTNLLGNAAPDYRKFVDNQVLTDDQLNDMLDHLNYQDQLSRVLLSGVGIVCGLHISKNRDENGQPFIHLTKGTAVTTAGNLLKSKAQHFKGFKKFTDSEVQYPRFTGIEGGMMPLWELEAETGASDVDKLEQFETKTDIALDDAIAVLYLEDYLHEQEECSPVDCNTQGREEINTLRVLLVSPGIAAGITFGDHILSQRITSDDRSFPVLPRLYKPRIVLNEVNAASYQKFKKAYWVSFHKVAEPIKQLGGLVLFKDMWDESGIKPEQDLEDFSASYKNIQYLYDFYTDLVTVYNELRKRLKKNYTICCPGPEAFPKHVLLGSVSSEESGWRHAFYPSPAHDHSNSIERMQSAFKRMLGMIKNFDPGLKDEIVITPSRGKDVKLGERAIPFYYHIDDEKWESFLQYWKNSGVELVPNYYGYGYPTQEFDPLDVCLQDHDFYRIEGHVGDHVMDAHKRIQKIKKDKGLAFDIKRVAIGKYADADAIDYDKHRMYFEDLQVVLQAWNEEQECMIEEATQFLSGFSTKTEGKHIGYAPTTDDENESRDNDSGFTQILMEPDEYTAVSVFPKKEKAKKQAPRNTVLKSMAKNKDTWGHLISEEKAITSMSNKNDIQMNIAAVASGFVLNWDNEIKKAAIDIPARLIGYLKETEDYKLTDVEDFTEENLQKYIKALQAQCQQVHQAKKQFQRLLPSLKNKDNEYVKPWLKQYEFILNRIASSCCIIKKIKTLFGKIIERKKELLNKLVLKKFIEDHPGAEHKAGVEKGGTFVLLYYSKNKKPAQNNLIYRRAIPLNIAQSILTYQPAYYYKTSEKTKKPESNPENLRMQPVTEVKYPSETLPTAYIKPGVTEELPTIVRSNRPRLPIGKISPEEKIGHGIVIGDLCLPYICCSDTPATQFVFPEQLAELRLPTDHICMDVKEGADSIPLNVKPADGGVKAFIQKRALSGVISVNQTGSYFVPNKVSREDYGKAIRFEVSGQPVDPTLSLYLKPRPGFAVEKIDYYKNYTVAVVTFRNNSKPFNKLSFEWDFDGKIEHNKGVKEFDHKFQVEPGENNEFNVKLTAFNGPCQETYSDTVVIKSEAPDEDCEAHYLQKIKDSRKGIEKELDEHPKILKNLRKVHYESDDHDLLKLKFEKIEKSTEKAFKGDFDKELFSFISSHQLLINKEVYGDRSNTEQEFKLKLYFDLMLLYFYLQMCRDAKFVKLGIITSDERGWLPFTELSIKKFSKALKAVLDKDNILEKLLSIQKEASKRDENNVSETLAKIIDMLEGFVD